MRGDDDLFFDRFYLDELVVVIMVPRQAFAYVRLFLYVSITNAMPAHARHGYFVFQFCFLL